MMMMVMMMMIEMVMMMEMMEMVMMRMVMNEGRQYPLPAAPQVPPIRASHIGA
jgi:hypothetical protein